MAEKEKKPEKKQQPGKQPQQAQGAKSAKAGKAAESKGAAAGPKDEHPKAASGKARLREHYANSVIPALRKDFGYQNPMAVPKIQKVSINIGLGEATGNSKLMDGAVNELAAIAGQKPVVTKAKKSIAAFKLREGMSIGCMVTLRGDRVRISGPIDERRAAARTRFSRRFAEIVRWAGELYARPEGSADLPRD
jgi:hypothetical protein